MKRQTSKSSQKEESKRNFREKAQPMMPVNALDRSIDSCIYIATIGALLAAIGREEEIRDETIRNAGDMIEREAERLQDSLRLLEWAD